MQELLVEPNDLTYPLSRQIFEDEHIVYHGTISAFSGRIESTGWKMSNQPYDINDIVRICNALELIAFLPEPYHNLKNFTLGSDDCYIEKKGAAFTHDYWLARSYATNRGGETFKNACLAVEEINKFFNNKEKQRDHRLWLDCRIYEVRDSVRNCDQSNAFRLNYIKSQLSILENAKKNLNGDYLLNWLIELNEIKKKYEKLTVNSYPVVYALRVRPEWFESWATPMYHQGDMGGGGNDLRANKDIPCDALVAKIEFPNGIEDDIYTKPVNASDYLPWLRGMNKV